MSFIPGDRVVVYNQKLSGEPIIEGRATIVKATEVDGRYKVRFDGDGRATYDRFVYGGDCQTEPEAYLANALGWWKHQPGSTHIWTPPANQYVDDEPRA